MDVTKLLDLIDRYRHVPEILQAGATAARDIGALVALIKANHDRSERVLEQGEQAELDAIHAETLRAIDAFDAELAAAAQS